MMQKFDRDFFRGMWGLTKTYWSSEERWQARGLLAVIVGLNLGYVYFLVLLNKWNNAFYNSLQNRDINAFWKANYDFSILAAIIIIIAVYKFYLQQMLEIKWRRWLTENYLQEWLRNRTYYQMHLLDDQTDNPDQRISEDLQLFASMTLGIFLGLLKAIVTLVSFIAILWQLSGSLPIQFGSFSVVIPGYMVWVALVYAIIGTWLTDKIGRPLARLNFDQQRFEADFRYSLVRLRENSESIAFYGGEAQEHSKFMERFRNVFNNFLQLMQRQKQLTWLTAGYGQIAIIFPTLVAAPRYFSNQIQLGGLIQISSAFGRVQDSLSFIVDTYPQLAQWQAVVNRLVSFTNNMNRVQCVAGVDKGIKIKNSMEKHLVVDSLDVKLPDGKLLLERLNLKVAAGDSLLISGPSGSGKSTLMRTLAGIWPFGQGTITIPQGQNVLFLPQKSYLPLGSLRDVLLYPYGDGTISDETLKETIRLCKLDGLKDHLNTVEDWSRILSLGEQQRIAFARALLQRPQWLFLDEATSALDEPTERILYTLLREKLPETAIISVGHRATLKDYHTKKLFIDGSGKWSILH